jgi:CysZ protein
VNAPTRPGTGSPEPKRSAGAEFARGMRMLGRGFAMYVTHPRLLLLGLIPALIAFLVLLAAFVALIVFIDDIGTWVTSWFADDWSSGARTAFRLLFEVAVVIGAVWLAVLTYTALTLLIGDPFYEQISMKIDERLGGASGLRELPWYRTLPRNAVDSLRLVVLGIVLAVPTLLVGLIPLVGQVAAPILGLLIGGWLLSVELTGIPFNRRGLFLSKRRAVLRRHRSLAMGFGIPVAVLLLIPFANIVVVPAAIAGATLLTRYVQGDPIDGVTA